MKTTAAGTTVKHRYSLFHRAFFRALVY
jgi:hypothetical protein